MIIGCDCGNREMLALYTQNEPYSKDSNHEETNSLYASSLYRHTSGISNRTHKLWKIVGPAIKKAEKNRTNRDAWTQPPSYFGNYKTYTKFQLQNLTKLSGVYGQRAVKRLKLQKHIEEKKNYHEIARQVAGGDYKNKKMLFICGITKNVGPMKGYSLTPKQAIVNAFQEHFDVMFVNEFRTSRICSLCESPLAIEIAGTICFVYKSRLWCGR